ncbi:bifunctional DNA primase/polymerase [Haloplanus salilacus]|uniref:bifunctional DNA primase/polymerase n=1 Tax=Haloplanus salilacus TaxID=2949994 RepID=UPI0030CF324E
MTSTLSLKEWARILDGDEPPALEVAQRLADARDRSVGTAQDAVYTALERGKLVEEGEGFGGVRLVEDSESEEPSNSTSRNSDNPEPREQNPISETEENSQRASVSRYRSVYLDAVEETGRESWEFVEEGAIQTALDRIGFAELVDNGDLFQIRGWRFVDVSDDGEDPRRRWYYPSGDEPRPEEFRRFHQALTAEAPDGYEPHYFKVQPAGKAPARCGSWKTDEARLTIDEAIEWLRNGGNVGVAGRPDDPLINVDIDDDEATTPADVPTSLRARSRSRTGWHTWYFDHGDEVPNIPTDEYGEVRTDWQYVVAPGSFVASMGEEIPDAADDPGYYTVEDDTDVTEIEYGDLPEVFREAAESVVEEDEDAESVDAWDGDSAAAESSDGRSAVFDIEAADLVQATDAGERFTSIFHDSDTGANMSVSGDKLHCWRHGVAHGGLQALATLSSEASYGCRELGAAHKNSGAGSNKLKGDWRLVWAAWYEAKRRGAVPSDDPVPYRALRGIAVRDGVVDESDLVDRDGETGDIVSDSDDDDSETYRALPSGTYDEVLDHIEDTYGVDPGRDSLNSGRPDSESDPEIQKGIDVTFATEVAWRAAGAVTPDELSGDLQVPTTDDGTSWECPRCGGEIGVVRAAALDMSIASGCCPDLTDETYHNAYQHTRRSLDAPLPEYVDHRMATERWDVVRGALQQLDFWHLDADSFNSEVTGRGDDIDGDAELTLDPAWRDSEGGESVLVFPSGTVYEAHPDHEGVLSVLRFVALDSGAISWDEFTDDEYLLSGDTFRHVYEIARMYGAPLPRWQGTDAYHTAVLPPADELVNEDIGHDERLQAARDGVADLYAEAAETDEASLLRVLPALGKTRQVFAQADEYPALYTADRKELMAEAVERANKFGVSSYILPVFAENGPPSEVTEAAAAAVRENGQHLLGQMWQLRDLVEKRLDKIDAELPDPSECDTTDEDEVQLNRESCPVANGKHGLGWWLTVHAARERGFRPQQIHENAPALFGRYLPCTCSDDEDVEDGGVTCPYTEGWETATDPEAPIDVLVGHYTYANVEGARTYSVKENDQVRKEPRVVALDEFAGDAFQRDFGDEYPDHAAWLGGALREDVDDCEDVFRKADDIWHDEVVRKWLDGDSISDEHAEISGVLGAADDALDATETAEWLLKNRRGACSDLGVEDALGRLTSLHPEWDTDVVTTVTADLTVAVTDEDNRGGHTSVLNHIDELVDRLRGTQLSDGSIKAALNTALDNAPHVDGALGSLVKDAVTGYRQRDDSARGRLNAARAALQGGREGCETLAMHAEDGYAHPLAYALLYGLLAPSDDENVATVRAESFTFGRDEGTTLNSVDYRKSSILVDRNQNGAVVNHPPGFTAGGSENPVVALDATGRSSLWELILGREVTTRDIHDSMRERREFLREVYGLQIVQTSQNAYSYEGNPSGKNLDDDIELVDKVGRQYAGVIGQKPAVITTNDVENHLEDRLSDVASATEHYGNLKGSNALADSRLAVLLGCQHFGDKFVERWAALAGGEVHRTGRGSTLNYNSPIGNELLRHMQEDQVMQAALRFGRDSGGALVFAHTAALRPDLPVVAEGMVIETFSKGAQATSDALSQLTNRRKLTVADVADALDDPPERRTVRRHLNRFTDAGFLKKDATPNGYANEFSVVKEPRPARIELPDCDTRAAEDDPGRDAQGVYYTWSVRVHPNDPQGGERREVNEAQLPAPGGAAGTEVAPVPPD